ncbi:phage major capsid protein [Terriglobus sp. ADX1]|uniref:phage major capsid protein n=1 Tax=Terriglobus sp. ADX1 TaxID=2794063 RepID=UPI002FE5F37D
MPAFSLYTHSRIVSTDKQIPQQLPVQYRAFALRAEKAQDGDNQPVPLSFSSDNPVKRVTWGGYWWNEILGHDAGEVIDGRMKQGLTLLVNHDPDQRAGRLENCAIDADGIGRGDAYFGTTGFAKTTRQEVDDKTLRYTSVGYIIHQLNRVADANAADDEDEDYLGTYRATWEPVEVSLVAVPADPSVGVGRSLNGAEQYPVRGLSAPKSKPAAAEKEEDKRMATPAVVPNVETTPAAPAAPTRDQIMTEFREMDAVRQQYPDIFTEAVRDTFIANKRSVSDAKSYVLDEQAKRSAESAVRPDAVVVVDAADKVEPGIRAARFVRSIAAGGKNGVAASARFAREVLKDAVIERALNASSMTAGGIFIPENISAEVIELLRPASVVRSFGPSLAPMANGSFTMNKTTSGTAASYIGENKPIPVTGMTAGAVKLSAKKLAALVPISNDLIRYSSYSADAWVRTDLVRAIAQKEDISFIRSTGSEFSPRGFRWLANQANVIAYTGDSSLGNVTNQLGLLVLALRKFNTPMVNPGWILSPRTEYFLMNLRDGLGNFAFRAEMLQGKLFMMPYKVTTQIPENLGAGTATEIILADFADVVIGDVPAISVETSGEASYQDVDGSAVSAFQNDQTLIRMIVEHDINVKRDTSIAVLTGVTLGS